MTPSVASLPGSSLDALYTGIGNAHSPGAGGYAAFGPGPTTMWLTPVRGPPADYGVEASLTVGSLQGGNDVFAGSLDQEAYALNALDGSVLTGFPFSTAAIADLYGTGP